MGLHADTLARQLDEGRRAMLAHIRRRINEAEVAEDILQESMLRAIRSAPGLLDEERVIPWFYRILNNAIIDYYRHRAIRPRVLQHVADHAETVIQPDDHALVCACLDDVIPTLKPEYAELITELEIGEGSPQDVADRLGITRNNLKVRRHRARTQLRERLEATCRVCATHGCLDCSCSSTRNKASEV